MAAGQLWAGVDVGKEHHWVAVLDDNGAAVLSRKLVNDERQILDLVAEVDALGDQVSWTVDIALIWSPTALAQSTGCASNWWRCVRRWSEPPT